MHKKKIDLFQFIFYNDTMVNLHPESCREV